MTETNKQTEKEGAGLSEKQQIRLLKEAIELNEKYRTCYFWTPPQAAASRRAAEERDQIKFEFETELGTLYVSLYANYSCKNVYFYRTIYLNDEKKDIRVVKKILRMLEMKNNDREKVQ